MIIVVKNFNLYQWVEIDFVLISAKVHGEENRELMMKKEDALFVVIHLLLISTLKPKLALGGAVVNLGKKAKLVKINNIRYVGKKDVYNMEVKDHHNFSVNGGLIVHNCMDMIRYFSYTVARRYYKGR